MNSGRTSPSNGAAPPGHGNAASPVDRSFPSPEGPVHSSHSPIGPRLVRVGVQIVGFLVGLAMLWWCADQALSPANRSQLERLGEAPASGVALLAGLTLATLVLNGLAFWSAVRPVYRLRAGDVIATNALATLLNYLPFKLSVLSRVLIHNRRDGVPVLTIGAWFAAVAAVLLAVYAPLLGVSLWRRTIDPSWWILGGSGIAACLGLMIAAARLFRGEPTRQNLASLLERRLERLGGRVLSRIVGSAAFARLHAGLDMLASWRMVALGAGVRVLDIGAQAARFVVAAQILGVSMSWQDATLVACTYFLIGVASPAGQLGTREAGTSWLAATLALAGGESLAVVVLLVSAVESVVSLAGAAVACAWLRLDKLVLSKRSPREAPAASTPAPTAPVGSLPSPDAPGSGPDQPDRRRP